MERVSVLSGARLLVGQLATRVERSTYDTHNGVTEAQSEGTSGGQSASSSKEESGTDATSERDHLQVTRLEVAVNRSIRALVQSLRLQRDRSLVLGVVALLVVALDKHQAINVSIGSEEKGGVCSSLCKY